MVGGRSRRAEAMAVDGATRAERGLIHLPDGTDIAVRPIRPADAAAHRRLIQRLSDRSRFLRFFHAVRELSAEQTWRFTHVDGIDRFALVALDPERPDEIIAVARYDREPGTDKAEYAIVVEDHWQGRGIGRALTRRLLEAARQRGIRTLYALVLPENTRALEMLRHLDLPVRERCVGGVGHVDVDLALPGGTGSTGVSGVSAAALAGAATASVTFLIGRLVGVTAVG